MCWVVVIISSLSKPDFTFIVQPRESLTMKAARLSERTDPSINKDGRGSLLSANTLIMSIPQLSDHLHAGSKFGLATGAT